MKRHRKLPIRMATGFIALVASEPLLVLIKHFVRRILRSQSDSSSGESDLGAGPLLGLLIAPGACYCFLLMEKYSSLINYFRSRTDQDLITSSIPEKLFFISISMAITGLVAVVKWDRILLNPQDFLNLAPLPIRRGCIMAANAISIALVAVLINAAVNLASCVLFPALVSAASPDRSVDPLPFFWAHISSVSLASLFMFLFVLAFMGTISVVAGGRWAQRATTFGRVVSVVSSLLLVPAATQAGLLWGSPHADGRLVWLPPLWFLDLYQELQSRGPVGSESLASMAIGGTSLAAMAAILSCGLLNRRHFAGFSHPQNRSSVSWSIGRLSLKICSLVPASPFERAIRDFTLLGLLRNDPHRLFLWVSICFGWTTAAIYFERNPAAALIPAYLLVLAISIAFRLPAELQANWVFRSALDRSLRPVSTAVLQAAAILATVLVHIPTAALLALRREHWSDCVLLSAFGGCMNWLHLEIVFGRWRGIPFTRPQMPFRQSLPARCALQCVAFAAYLWIGGRLYHLTKARPTMLFFLIALCLSIRWWNHSQERTNRSHDGKDTPLDFENSGDDAVQTLGLG